MRIVDSRRMTGSNLYTRESGALLDLAFDPDDDADAIVARWARTLATVWDGEQHVRRYAGGAALFVTGPLDALMPLTDLNEWALGLPGSTLDLEAIRAEIRAAHVPNLAELIAAAREHGVALLVDEDAITLGTGRAQLRFARPGALPEAAAIDWDALGRIPIGIVTGTNGKTTTTRLVARMAKAAGMVPGITSSDGVAVDEVMVQRGDFSGPEGTRLVLRHPDVEIAILETARGGILRRGLTVERCDAALITNVSADHLGDYGVDDVAMMAQVKGVVGRDARVLILNADDPASVALGAGRPNVQWFSRNDPPLVPLAEIPITFGGRATYNVENAMAATALARALGIPDAAIARGLREFTSSAMDNPGRGNLIDVGGVSLLLDFGHNPAAIRAVLALAHSLTRGALRITIGMPGDRVDADLREVAREIAAGRPTEVVVRELGMDFLRGRAAGDVPALLATSLRDAGIPVTIADDELAAVQQMLAASRPGDLVLVLAHLDPAVDAFVAAMT